MRNFKVVLLCLLIFGGLYMFAQDDNPTGNSNASGTSGGNNNGGGSVTQSDQRMQNITSGNTPVIEKPATSSSSTQAEQNANAASAPTQSAPRRAKKVQVVPINQLPSFANRPINNFDFRQGTRKRMRGFRIQMYWGNTLRTDYLKAKRMGDKVMGAFPELKSYVSFDQPHWRCRIGDFKTRAGASRYLERMRKIAPEAMIVRSEIYIYQ